MQKFKRHELCPCGSRQRFDACCLPYHEGKRLPPTPESLMRARYSAYCVGAVDFIMETWDNPRWNAPLSTSPEQLAEERQGLLEHCREVTYLKLEVLSTEPVDARGWAYVTFVASFKLGRLGATQRLHERSAFEKQGPQWMYLHGVELPARG